MEISREHRPLLRTTVKGLAKVKLQGQRDLSKEEVYRIIATRALQEEDSCEDYTMLAYDDHINFEKSQTGFTYPEIPYTSIVRLVVLPNFPDVCFIQFRRSTYGMYVVFRIRKVSYLPKLAKFIYTWNDAISSDSDNAQTQLTQKVRNGNDAKNEHRASPLPIIVHSYKRPSQEEKKMPRPSKKSSKKSPKRSPHKPHTVKSPDLKESCEFVCIKHNHKVVPSRQGRKKSHSPPPPQPRFRIRFEKRSHSEPRFIRDSEVRNYRPRFRSQTGTYTIIVPTSKKVRPPRGFYIVGKQRRLRERERIVLAMESQSDSQSSSDLRLTEILSYNGDEVKTIYPSSLDLRKLSPKSLRNERLIQKLRRPISSN